MVSPLSDTARAIRVLDERYGETGWKVFDYRPVIRDETAVAVGIPGRSRYFVAVCSTARDAILRAAERVQAETPERRVA